MGFIDAALLLPPFPDHPGVQRVMAVCIEPQAMSKRCLPRELFLRHALDIFNQLAVGNF